MTGRIRYCWIVCPLCGGSGKAPLLTSAFNRDTQFEDCSLCLGEKKLKAQLLRAARGSAAKSGRTGIKMTAEDKAWARQVKQRDHHRCRRCGRGSPDWQVHAAHIFGRRSKATRTNVDNGICLCSQDHAWAHANTADFRDFVIEQIGQEKYDELQSLAQTTKKRVARRTE